MAYIHVGRVATIVDEKRHLVNFNPAPGVTIYLDDVLKDTVDAALAGLSAYSIDELKEFEEEDLSLETRDEDDRYFDVIDAVNAINQAELAEHYASHQVPYDDDVIAVWRENEHEVDSALFGRHGDMGSFDTIISAVREGVSAFIYNAAEESLRDTLASIADAVEEYED